MRCVVAVRVGEAEVVLRAGVVLGGALRRRRAPAAGAALPLHHAAGLGLGLRYTQGRVSASAEWARLITGSKVPLTVNADSPQKGDHKLHVNLMIRF